MSEHRSTPDAQTKRFLGALIVWNLFDIAIHVAVEQVEILRVTGNAVLIIAAAAILLRRGGSHPAHPLVLALVVFVVLNGVFIIGNGPAVPMTILIAGSVLLTGAAIQRLRPAFDERRITIGRRPGGSR